MWQKKFEQHRNDGFTVVGLSLDAEGIAPAKRYYDKFGVTFPALVDPNYATKFGAVPKTFFIDEHGVVLDTKAKSNWETQLTKLPEPRAVSDKIRNQWTDPTNRFAKSSIDQLVAANQAKPNDLAIAAELGSRYISLDEHAKAETILARAAESLDAREIARGDKANSRRLARVYLQWSRSALKDRDQQVARATTSFFLDPSVGYGKQIARIIAPEKFDGRPKGDFDNRFRENTLKRLTAERKKWLSQ